MEGAESEPSDSQIVKVAVEQKGRETKRPKENRQISLQTILPQSECGFLAVTFDLNHDCNKARSKLVIENDEEK